ncbi:MAG: hypothetical protein ACOH1O_06235 [Flavobacterium sp.]
MRYRFAFSAFFTLALQSCQTNLSNEDITASVWKCGVPCGLSDILIFDKNTTIRNDTIFHHTAPYGKIVRRISDFDEDAKISVINLRDSNTKDTCIYHAK